MSWSVNGSGASLDEAVNAFDTALTADTHCPPIFKACVYDALDELRNAIDEDKAPRKTSITTSGHVGADGAGYVSLNVTFN
jgi:hypothetical protein